ncbi:MAG: radical SAM protein [Candidatus Competibacteraceae bacterium]
MHDPALIAADADTFRQTIKQGLPYRPLYVKLKLVWDCNLRCGMCLHWRERSDPPLPTTAWSALIDELAQLGCRKLHLSGGEPTLNRALALLIARATEQGIRVTMTTNAVTLTPKCAVRLVAAGLRRANVSLDSPDPVIHDQQRGVAGSWRKAVAGFRALHDCLPPGRLRINTVVTALNYATLAELPAWAAKLGAAHLNLIPLDVHTPELGAMTTAQVADFNTRIAPILAQDGRRLGLLKSVADAYPFGRSVAEYIASAQGHYARGYYDQHRCYAPWAHALIDHAGRVSVCCMTPRQPTLGDLRQQSFTEIWGGAAYTALRRATSQPLFPACRQCDMFLSQNRCLDGLMADSVLGRWLGQWRCRFG